MASTRGRCSNFDYCSLADKRQDIPVALGQEFICPECGKALRPPPVVEPQGGGAGRFALVGALGLVVVGGGVVAYTLFNGEGATKPLAAAQIPPVAAGAPRAVAALPPPAQPAQAPRLAAAQAVPAAPETVLLRLSGSNTVGAVLGPRLAQAFLTSTGDSNVTIVNTGTPDEVKIVGERDGKREVIDVAAHGSATAFTDLAKGAADVGMASRRIKPAEADSLKAAGDMTDAFHEHVLALDGLAVIVNPGNGVGALTKAQLRDIFAGTTKNWSEVGGTPGAIHIFARDDKSGTYDTFKALVLGTAKLSPAAKRIEDSRELSADVSADAGAIGFIGLPYVLTAKAVPVSDTGATPLLPNRLTVATEDYALSRRLFLYTGAPGGNALAPRFAAFALSPEGQAIVEQTGFIPLTVKPEASAVPVTASDRYRKLVGKATRLSTNFRFKANSADLDNRGQRDLDRLVNFVVSAHAAPTQIILVGFADNKGNPALNLAVSKKRADAVAAGLAERGLRVGQVAAFGAELPVADNGSDDGREKNRRVEVYMHL